MTPAHDKRLLQAGTAAVAPSTAGSRRRWRGWCCTPPRWPREKPPPAGGRPGGPCWARRQSRLVEPPHFCFAKLHNKKSSSSASSRPPARGAREIESEQASLSSEGGLVWFVCWLVGHWRGRPRYSSRRIRVLLPGEHGQCCLLCLALLCFQRCPCIPSCPPFFGSAEWLFRSCDLIPILSLSPPGLCSLGVENMLTFALDSPPSIHARNSSFFSFSWRSSARS